MADDSIHDDIREIRQALTTLVAQGARTEQMYVGLNDRLYNGGNGAIPVMFKTITDIKASVDTNRATAETACTACRAEIKTVANSVQAQRVWVSGIALGVSLALNGGKAVLGKIFHF